MKIMSSCLCSKRSNCLLSPMSFQNPNVFPETSPKIFQVKVWGQHVRILEPSSESLAGPGSCRRWIKDSPGPVMIWLRVHGRSCCPLAKVTFSSYFSGVTNKGLWGLFFSGSLLPLSYCLQRCLTNSCVLNDYLPLTTVSGLKRKNKSIFQRTPLQGICSTSKCGFHRHLNPWQYRLRAVLETRSSKQELQ